MKPSCTIAATVAPPTPVGQRQMGINDLITLLWNGTAWLRQSFADN
jgi:hypothetical protein